MNLVSHLWQSTLCVGVAALLAFAARRASARTRHAIWLFASLKFLIPLSVFVVAGSYLGAWTSALTTSRVSVAVRWLDQSLSLWSLDAGAGPAGAGFAAGLDRVGMLGLVLVWASGIAGLSVWRWKQWQAVSRLASTATPLEDGREAEALRRVPRPSPRARRIAVLQCESTFEPGVLGVFRPQLLWPAGLSDRLSDAELDAILAHEACHVDRRDNLSALIQMVVETLFWFHPAVWWIGARLVSERERACDEEVLQMGTDKESYAEGILKVCGFCLRSPVAFVAGVGGSHLTRRIEDIFRRPIATSATISTRLLLASVVIVTVGASLAAGVVSAHRGTAIGRASDGPGVAPQQEEPQVLRPGNGVTQPKLVYEVKPNYTKEAMVERIQGSVWLDAVVLENGSVGEVRVVRSLDSVHGLDNEAVNAIKQWRFEPATKDKQPVAVRIDVEMSFKLK